MQSQEWLFTMITVRPFIALSTTHVLSSTLRIVTTSHPVLNVTSITRITTTGMVTNIITVEDKKSPAIACGAF
jgi:hypothetical protein